MENTLGPTPVSACHNASERECHTPERESVLPHPASHAAHLPCTRHSVRRLEVPPSPRQMLGDRSGNDRRKVTRKICRSGASRRQRSRLSRALRGPALLPVYCRAGQLFLSQARGNTGRVWRWRTLSGGQAALSSAPS
ncbi:hypothetical protein AAFF_G00180740 [Aldrovandia affinis]|uniref:Uncharacterized protein n=1 Tax=Aldrovandia affinis TaxID=143900 RepID=A0AAD7SYC6_9TELE|nr:hypothetical protein AAFF_G00180740 [Aldrovandia affinis]